MSLNPAFAFPEAVDNALKTNTIQQTITAKELIADVGDYLPLSIAWSTQLNSLEYEEWADTMDAQPKHPWDAARIAVASAKYTEASAKMAQETGALSNIIDSQKMQISNEAQSLSSIYGLVGVLTQETQLDCMLLRLTQNV